MIMENRRNEILELSFDFALAILKFYRSLDSETKHVIGFQLLKSGTSIGANVHEAQCAESANDFIHKMKIASKEALEASYWMKIMKSDPQTTSPPGNLEKSIDSIQKILSAIISSTKKRLQTKH
jgi:four helix bundle protein